MNERREEKREESGGKRSFLSQLFFLFSHPFSKSTLC
jgi:hypothetical protein